MKNFIFIVISVLFFLPAAKGQGEIYGTVTDEKGNPFQSVSISVYQSGKLFLSTISEDDGSYSLKPIPVGCFKVEFKAEHYIKRTTVDLPISSGGCVKLNCKMIEGRSDSEMIVAYKMPTVFRKERIEQIIETSPTSSNHTERIRLGVCVVIPKIKPNYIYLSWAEQLKYTNFPLEHRQKQITKKYTEKDFQYIPFGHFLETLPGLQR